MSSANESSHYCETSSLIGRTQTQNDPILHYHCSQLVARPSTAIVLTININAKGSLSFMSKDLNLPVPSQYQIIENTTKDTTESLCFPRNTNTYLCFSETFITSLVDITMS